MPVCPSREELQQFLNDGVSREENGWLLAHLDDCAACQERLEELTADGDETPKPGPVAAASTAEWISPTDLERWKDAFAGVGLTPVHTGVSIPTTPPRQIGPYAVVRELGRGGMGVVYLAEQPRLKRLVALKVIRAGAHASAEELARFRAEAEAVARFQHPNIVQIHEIGEWEDLSYLALEYVDGGSLAQHAARTPQDPRAAAELVERLARAMHYAHEHGVIHRDLKPANILLAADSGQRIEGRKQPAEQDATCSSSVAGLLSFVPKIADFGLAKALADPAGPTQTGAVVGTPSYMAAEQARGGRAEIGPATDVYGLGAVFYELLTGRPPFVGTTALSTLEQVTSQDPVPPTRLQRHVPRDLETICLKCLAKEPQKRYRTALALADDVRRFLDGRPILARRTSAGERAWKWSRRRPLVSGLAAALVLVAAMGYSGVVWQWRSAVAAAAGARRERDAARAAQKKTDAINTFLLDDLLGEAAPENHPRQEKVTVEAILDVASRKVATAFADQPELEASLRLTLGGTYRRLGLYDRAEPHLRRAVALYEQLRGIELEDAVNAREVLATLLQVRGQYDEAEALFRNAVAQRTVRDGPDDPKTLTVINNLALLLMERGTADASRERFEEAGELFQRALAGEQRVKGVEHWQTLTTEMNLGLLLRRLGKFDEAMSRLQHAADGFVKARGPDHPDTVRARANVANLLRAMNRLEEAEPLLRESLEEHRRAYGPEHPNTLIVMTFVGELLWARGRFAEAEGLFRQDLEITSRVLGAKNARTINVLGLLALVLRDEGALTDAEPLCRQLLVLRRETLPAGHVSIAAALCLQGAVLVETGRPKQAEPLLRAALAVFTKVHAPGHTEIANCMSVMGACLVGLGRYSDAEPLLVGSYDTMKKGKGVPEHQLGQARQRIVQLYEQWGKPEELAAWKRKDGQ